MLRLACLDGGVPAWARARASLSSFFLDAFDSLERGVERERGVLLRDRPLDGELGPAGDAS